jgi:ankyrin repeat protein
MDADSLLSRICYPPIPRCVSIMLVVLVTLACSNSAYCGEIHNAAKQGDLAKVRALLESNPDLVSSKDDDGNTPLFWAAARGHADVAELLLANHAEVNAKNNSGSTPLKQAAFGGRADVVELLLANGAEVNAKSDNGMTALHDAAGGGYTEVTKLLLANKADVNANANKGFTPLHDAAGLGRKDVAELLLANGAEVNAKENQGRMPLDYATQNGHEDVEELLRQHGAQSTQPPPPASAQIRSTTRPRLASWRRAKCCSKPILLWYPARIAILAILLCTGRRARDTRMWRNCFWLIRPRSMLRTTADGRLSTARRFLSRRTWWNCCWPITPMSMPGPAWAKLL